MSKKILIIGDSHIYSYSEWFKETSIEKLVTYIPILFYKDPWSSLLNSRVDYNEDSKYGISKNVFNSKVLSGELIGESINFSDYKKIIFIGNFLFDRLISRVFSQRCSVYPFVFSENSDLFISRGLLCELIRYHLEWPAINAIKFISGMAPDSNVLVIPGPPISNSVICNIFDAGYANSFVDVSGVLKSQMDSIAFLLKQSPNVNSLTLNSYSRFIDRNGYLLNKYVIEDGNIHANKQFGHDLGEMFVKEALNNPRKSES